MKYDIGIRIRKFRKKRNMTQKDLAKKIGVSNSRISNWEQGINRPDADMLVAICNALEVSPSDLLDLYLPFDTVNEKEVALVKAYRENPSLQNAVDLILGLKD